MLLFFSTQFSLLNIVREPHLPIEDDSYLERKRVREKKIEKWKKVLKSIDSRPEDRK